MSKIYFLASSRDTPPKGPIFLGSIIKSPRSPELSLNGKKSPLLPTLDVSTHTQTDSSHHLFKTSNGKAGIWAEFVVDLGISGNVSGNWDNVDISSFKFRELVTQTISPSFAEISEMFREEAVQSAIKDSRFRDNIYVITGIKIAKGAEVVIQRVRGKGGNLHFGLDLTTLGAPVKVGPDIKEDFKMGQTVKEKHEEEFVWAYRLREIKYRRKQVTGQKEYANGDLWGKGPKERKMLELEDQAEGEAELMKLREEDVDGEVWGAVEDEVVDDDGVEVRCVKLEDEEDEED